MPWCVRIYNNNGNLTDKYCVENEPVFSPNIYWTMVEIDDCANCPDESDTTPPERDYSILTVLDKIDILRVIENAEKFQMACEKYPWLCPGSPDFGKPLRGKPLRGKPQ